MKNIVRAILLALAAYIALSVCGGIVLWIFRATAHLVRDALRIGVGAGILLLAWRWVRQRAGK